ncbi:MATE family efflux transporter [Treponema parvum]|uniref:MATE family efflux transporter n=1 Tax=Treponema parvum TaxID=138851 RepID=UPI001AEC0953|nr:MATE family efflux transporter [Treponema parvum]QTQ16696.1 MATE family efflux transporter [Treponema parvum]
MAIKLSDHFTYGKLFKFTLPSIATMIFSSIFGVVDGFFVSNFVGKQAFAAINLIMPFLLIFGAVGFMFGTGGSALVSMILGQGDNKKANRIFSLLIYLLIIIGAVFTVAGNIFLKTVAVKLGATEEMLPHCMQYGHIILFSLVPFMLQYVFQSFLVTAERPALGLAVTLIAGSTNMVLDALFIAVFKWGVAGAAFATVVSQMFGGLIPLVYFILPNKTVLRLGKTGFDGKAVFKTCTNGSSEFMSSISASFVSMLYNFTLMKYAGEQGVASYGVIMYISFIFAAVFLGYSVGSSPIVSYHYGMENYDEMKGLFKKSTAIIVFWGIGLTGLSKLLAHPLAMIFVSYDKELLKMTERAFSIYSFSFLFAGLNIYGSSFFTALNNGLISAIISFARTLVFNAICVLTLPLIFKIDGVWLSVVFAEILALIMTAGFIIANRKKYRYI